MVMDFWHSRKVFLEVCKEKHIPPAKQFSGKFNLRIPPSLHGEIANRAAAEDQSINQWFSEVLEESVGEKAGK
jgi:predicted HicB family RNase H-like nuclease